MPKMSYLQMADLIDHAVGMKVLRTLVEFATEMVRRDELTPYAYASLLKKASDRIYSISNH